MSEFDEMRLVHTSTCWSVVCRAQEGDEAQAARHSLLQRYGGAVQRYLRGALRDWNEADELYQEFAVRLLRGDFRRATPEKGRFRDFVKIALVRLVSRHLSRRQRGPRSLAIDVEDPRQGVLAEADEQFRLSWRAELLSRAWQALQQYEQQTGRPYYRTLRLRVERPKANSTELAAYLSHELEKDITAANLRQTLHRARNAFAGFLLNEVVQSQDAPTPDEIHHELAALGLLEYCRPALDQMDNRNSLATQSAR